MDNDTLKKVEEDLKIFYYKEFGPEVLDRKSFETLQIIAIKKW